MTVRELGSRMDADELADWAAVFDMEREERDRQNLAQTVEHELTQARQE